ncbi:aromatic ring-hydroxylating oxygenase subunit alpha [Azospirillum soli]|uniref:aromatic ring-hydroxylating oxygenase subunit alpha n=1 Tax=Azospirillum soli TaxID=1304799 RepID=UPI001AE41160|nr:aromatic ring-hydroxylating dioxygenase subunit alpha [Azospirillum soli]MBP2316231.1 phenylpropionate dioxygenase-like ring-hydroxylating dioxygenase large terminal subunit [Azospirillum soli]
MSDASPKRRVEPPSATVISTARYSDPTVFEEERKRIFRRSWIFIGFAEQLAQPNDFVTADIAGTSVVVQNFDGALAAFHNVCTHRYSVIQQEPCGNRRLECPYHGWLFNREGVPVGIPGNEKFFGFDRAAKEKLALPRFEVAVRGRFVFVRLEAGGESLDDFLGAYGPLLDDLSAFTNLMSDETQVWQANWKIGVESVLEPYHVDATHPETFKTFIRKQWENSTEREHSRCLTRMSDHSTKWWNGVARALGLQRDERYCDYDHYFIFPNLSIAVTHGALLSVQTYDPVDAEVLRLRFRLLTVPGRKTALRDGAAWTMLSGTVQAFNAQVLSEDRRVSESTHRGSKQVGGKPAVPGLAEDRLFAFHGAYLKRMGAER